MFIALLFIILLCLTLLFIKQNDLCADTAFLNKDFTTQVRGIAILWVMVSHCIIFMYLSPELNNHNLELYEKVLIWFTSIFTNIGVGFFFFLSGYGNYFSINKQKKENWLLSKILMIYCAFLLLLIIPYCLHFFKTIYAPLFPHFYSIIPKIILLNPSQGVGWYIKVQLILYIFFYLTTKIFHEKTISCINIILSIYVVFAILLNIPTYWYITILSFPLGICCTKYKNILTKYLYQNTYCKLICLAIIESILFYCLSKFRYDFLLIIISLISCLILMLLSLKIRLKSKFLTILGQNTLMLYFLHGELIYIFIKLQPIIFNKVNTTIYSILVLVFSIFLAPFIKKLSDKFSYFLYTRIVK